MPDWNAELAAAEQRIVGEAEDDGRNEMDANDAIAALQQQGYRVIKELNPNEELRTDWKAAIAGLRIARDRVASGARLTIRHPPYMNPAADQKALLRAGLIGLIDDILQTAEVVRE